MFKLLLRSPRSPSLSRSFLTHHPVQSGHNKWSKIKDKKGANDAQKSVLYTKMNREISNAVKVGGSLDPEKNTFLATTLKKAREQGVPKDNIEKALANCARSKEHTGERMVYEALAFKSVGVIIECVTDNINRTIHNVREILTSHGAHMTPVNFMFSRVGCVIVEVVDGIEAFERFEELMIENDVKDIMPENSTSDSADAKNATFRVYCDPSELASLQEVIEQSKDEFTATIQSAELTYVPVDRMPSAVGSELDEQVQELVEDLEDIDEITKVWTSLD